MAGPLPRRPGPRPSLLPPRRRRRSRRAPAPVRVALHPHPRRAARPRPGQLPLPPARLWQPIQLTAGSRTCAAAGPLTVPRGGHPK
eukprot:7533110-Lingulodinium_polyedra.AAC.1